MPNHAFYKAAYTLGRRACLQQLRIPKHANYHGFPAEESESPELADLPPEILEQMLTNDESLDPSSMPLEGMPPENAELNAEAFAGFAQSDDTEEATTQAAPSGDMLNERSPNWSGKSSLESGDTGMRNYEMGLPRTGGV